MRMRRDEFVTSASLAAIAASLPGTIWASTPAAGVSGNAFLLSSDGIAASWSVDGGTLRMVSLKDRLSGAPIAVPDQLFSLSFANGDSVKCSEFAVASTPRVVRTPGNPQSSRYAGRIGETSIAVDLTHASTGARATWRAIASDGALYLRQELTLTASTAPLTVRNVELVRFENLSDVLVIGSTDGAPAVSNSVYVALEHPFSQGDAVYDRVTISLPRKVDVQPGVPLVASMVIGTTRPGQLRRDFLGYVERERAHPYRTFLHYNSWYDLGYFTPYTADQCVGRIHTFGRELHDERGVTLASFLFDDGWDDYRKLWQFNSGFPDGFVPLKVAAEKYGARPGAWLSPWGGYSTPRKERLATAKAGGYEINDSGLALSGPKYYELFHETVVNFIETGGVNQFKLDGTGNDGNVVPGSAFGNDFEAAIALIGDMRALEPDIYVNLTTGTYPSPFWLRYADSIWRGGYDHNFEGAGTQRQRWITYRDADTYDGIVAQGPLFPLNSLMLHGMIYATHAKHLSDDPGNDFRSEIHSYFGNGTQLQEMYITPELLSTQNWNDIAEAAMWSRANAATLVDTHWVGGNPNRLDVYGWASWSPAKATLTLRNPSDRRQAIALDPQVVFELPREAPQAYIATSAFRTGKRERIALRAGTEHLFTLEPFEAIVLDVRAGA